MSGSNSGISAGSLVGKSLLVCLIAAAAALTLAGLLQLDWRWPLAGMLLSAGWWMLRSRLTWYAGIGLIVYTLTAAGGVLAGLSPLLMLAAASASLAAWDLQRFESRLSSFPEYEGSASLYRAHMRRLFLVILAGLLVGGLALVIHVQASFTFTAGVVLILAFVLSRLVRMLQQS